jgi:hypothetical protein
MADIISGDVEVKTTESAATVAPSGSSPKRARRNTGKTNSLTAEQSLEILQQSVINCQQSGVDAKATNFYHHGCKSVIIVLANTELIDGDIMVVAP